MTKSEAAILLSVALAFATPFGYSRIAGIPDAPQLSDRDLYTKAFFSGNCRWDDDLVPECRQDAALK